MKKEILTLMFVLLAVSLVIGVYAEENSSLTNHTDGSVGSGATGCERGTAWNSESNNCEDCLSGTESYLDGPAWRCRNINTTTTENTPTNGTVDTRNRNNNSMGIGQQLREKIRETKQEIKEGNYTGPMGRKMMVSEISKELKEIRIENSQKMSTKLNMSIQCRVEEGNQSFDTCNKKMDVMLRNGSLKEIKIMPDTAADRAIERLGIKVCNDSNNCTIELKDVGNKKLEKLRYEVMVQKERKLFGLFNLKSQDRAEVDPETGETIVKKPWWAFLAKDVKE